MTSSHLSMSTLPPPPLTATSPVEEWKGEERRWGAQCHVHLGKQLIGGPTSLLLRAPQALASVPILLSSGNPCILCYCFCFILVSGCIPTSAFQVPGPRSPPELLNEWKVSVTDDLCHFRFHFVSSRCMTEFLSS